ncbi:mucin-2-like [Musca vetustissima]|uniref:mucin-2-like n=1 Tax=Musca vetustissima TaxID=27455 RepID=UPI002AB5FE4A|nr:mucin-2-like [Musca vetustissima]
MGIGMIQCAPIEVTTSTEDFPEITTILPNLSEETTLGTLNKTQAEAIPNSEEAELSSPIDLRAGGGIENYAKTSYFIPVEVRFDEIANTQSSADKSRISGEGSHSQENTTNEIPSPENTSEDITEPQDAEKINSQNQNENSPKIPTFISNENHERNVKSITIEGENDEKLILNDSQNENQNSQFVPGNPQILSGQNVDDIQTISEVPVIFNIPESVTEPFKGENRDSQQGNENPHNSNENPQIPEDHKEVDINTTTSEIPSIATESITADSLQIENKINFSIVSESENVAKEDVSASQEENEKSPKNAQNKGSEENLNLSEEISKSTTESINSDTTTNFINENQSQIVTEKILENPQNMKKNPEINETTMATLNVSPETENPPEELLKAVESNNPQEYQIIPQETSNNPVTVENVPELPHESIEKTTENQSTVTETSEKVTEGITESSNSESETSSENPQKSPKTILTTSEATVKEISMETARNTGVNILSTNAEIPDQMAVESQNGETSPVTHTISENHVATSTIATSNSYIEENATVTQDLETTTENNQNTSDSQIPTENSQKFPILNENIPTEENSTKLENSSQKLMETSSEINFAEPTTENMESLIMSENPQFSPVTENIPTEENTTKSESSSEKSMETSSELNTAEQTTENMAFPVIFENSQISPVTENVSEGLISNKSPSEIVTETQQNDNSQLLVENPQIVPVLPYNQSDKIYVQVIQDPIITETQQPSEVNSEIPSTSPEVPTIPVDMVILTETSPKIEAVEQTTKNINFNAQLPTEDSQNAGVYMLMEMFVPETVQETPKDPQETPETTTQFSELYHSREGKSLEITSSENKESVESTPAALEENVGEESMTATQVADREDSETTYENPGFIKLNDHSDIMDDRSFPTTTLETGATEIPQASGENQTNGETNVTNAPSILSEDQSESTAKLEEVALMSEEQTTSTKAAATTTTTESTMKFEETTLSNLEVKDQEMSTSMPESATTTSMPYVMTNGNTERSSTEKMNDEPSATTINQFASLLAETEMNVHKAFETLREYISHGPITKDDSTMKAMEESTNGELENSTNMPVSGAKNEDDMDIPNTTTNSPVTEDIQMATEESSGAMDIKEQSTESTAVTDSMATTTEQGVAETTIVPTLARVQLEKDLTSINLTYLDDSSEEEMENDRSKEHQVSQGNSQEKSQENQTPTTTETNDFETATGITEMVKFIKHETESTTTASEEVKTMLPQTQATFMQEQEQQIETTTVKEMNSSSTANVGEKEEEEQSTETATEMSSNSTEKNDDSTETSHSVLTTTATPSSEASSTVSSVITTTYKSETRTDLPETTTTMVPETTTYLPETTTTLTDISEETTTFSPEELTTTVTEEPEIETTTLLTTVAPEPRSLPPPKLEYLQSEDGVEVFYGYSIVKHN